MSDCTEKYLLATNALLHLCDWKKLMQFCDLGLKYSEESEFCYLKGKAVGKLGNNVLRIEWMRKAVQLNPAVPAYRRNLAAAYYQDKRYEEAISEQQRTVDLEPANPINHHNLATTLFRMGSY
jgi:tetratricopeptide (TPR) repeat protein